MQSLGNSHELSSFGTIGLQLTYVYTKIYININSDIYTYICTHIYFFKAMYMERASLFVTVAATMAADKQEAANN